MKNIASLSRILRRISTLRLSCIISHTRILPRIAATVLFSALLILLATGCVTDKHAQEGGQESGKPGQTTKTSWEDDIAVFENRLPKLHKNLFFSISKQEYMDRLARIKEELPNPTDREIEIRLRRLLADVGDAHTDLSWNVERAFPLTFTHFAEGVFLRAASAEYADYVGMELTAIDDVPIHEVRRRIAEIIPYENEAQLWKMYTNFLVFSDYLQALGIIAEDTAVYRFRDENRQEHTVTVSAVDKKKELDWYRLLGDEVPFPEDQSEIPLYIFDTRTAYRMHYLNNEQILYIQYNSCTNDPDNPFNRFKREVEQKMKQEPVRKLVIDLRFNGGGNSLVFRPLIGTLAREYERGRDYELYAVIGRYTFSSAVLNAIDLKQKAGAVLIGEPTGGKPNHYGEVKRTTLPHSGLTLSYSTKYFTRYKKDTNTLRPDIEVLWSFENFSSLQDGVMEEIKRR